MGFVLKTDLFEEAVGDGLYPLLPQWARSAIGIDLSHTAVARAMRRHRQLKGLVADVRRLPFKSGSFDSIVSTSTLDHFGRASDIEAAFAELNRVLRPGGELVITMDNARNPVIALRERVQAPLLWLGILPYFTGVSCDAGGLRRLLTEAGFQIRGWRTVFRIGTAARTQRLEPADAIIVFGAAIWGAGPSATLRLRTMRGVELYEQGLAPVVVCSGGSSGGVSEPRLMADLMVAHGVPASALGLDEAGVTTRASIASLRRVIGGNF